MRGVREHKGWHAERFLAGLSLRLLLVPVLPNPMPAGRAATRQEVLLHRQAPFFIGMRQHVCLMCTL